MDGHDAPEVIHYTAPEVVNVVPPPIPQRPAGWQPTQASLTTSNQQVDNGKIAVNEEENTVPVHSELCEMETDNNENQSIWRRHRRILIVGIVLLVACLVVAIIVPLAAKHHD
jgi:hypothetical protein